MKGRHHEKWVAVSDSVWPDAMVESRPETIQVDIVVSWSEHARRQSQFVRSTRYRAQVAIFTDACLCVQNGC
jgi:hypothetical protein